MPGGVNGAGAGSGNPHGRLAPDLSRKGPPAVGAKTDAPLTLTRTGGIKPGGAHGYTPSGGTSTGQGWLPAASAPDKFSRGISGSQGGGFALFASGAFKSLDEADQQAVIHYLTTNSKAEASKAYAEVCRKFDAADYSFQGRFELISWLNEINPARLATPRPFIPRDKIEPWLVANHGRLTRAAGDLIGAELGALAKDGASKADLIYLISRALPQPGENYFGVAAESLVKAVHDEPALRGAVAEYLFNRAIELESSPAGDGKGHDPHRQAFIYAWNALSALADDEKTLGEIVAHLPPREALLAVEALANGNSDVTPDGFNRVLRALNSVPPTETTRTVVAAISDLISVSMISGLSPQRRTNPQLIENLATAWAREWHPGQTAEIQAARRSDEQRIAGVLSDRRGAILWCTGSIKCKHMVREAFRRNASLDVKTVQSSAAYPIAVPTIAMEVARATVAQSLAENIKIASVDDTVNRLATMLQQEPEQLPFFNGRFVPSVEEQTLLAVLLHPEIKPALFKDGPWPRELQKVIAHTYAAMDAARFPTATSVAMPNMNAIANMVGAIYGKTPSGMDDTSAAAAEIKQAWSSKDLPAFATDKNYFANDPDVGKVLKAVAEVTGNKFPVMMRFVDATIFSDTYGAIKCPAFEIETRNASGNLEYAYITNDGAIHKSGIQPEKDENGRERTVFRSAYEKWQNDPKLPAGELWVSGHHLHETHATHDANQTIDKIAMAGSFVGGVPLVLAAAWTIYRNVDELAWRREHGLSISPTDPNARRLLFSTLMQVTMVASPFFRALGAEAGAGFNVVSRGVLVADIADQLATAIKEGRTLTPEELLSLAFAGLALRHAPKEPEAIPTARVVKIGDTGADKPSAAPAKTADAPMTPAEDRAIAAQNRWPGQTPSGQPQVMPVVRVANDGDYSPGQAGQTVPTDTGSGPTAMGGRGKKGKGDSDRGNPTAGKSTPASGEGKGGKEGGVGDSGGSGRTRGKGPALPVSEPAEPAFSKLSEHEQREQVEILTEELKEKFKKDSVGPRGPITVEESYEWMLITLRFKKLPPASQAVILRAIKNHPNVHSINRLTEMLWCNWFRNQTLEDQQRSAKFVASYAVKTRGQDETLRGVLAELLFKFTEQGPELHWKDPDPTVVDDNEDNYFATSGENTTTVFTFNRTAIPADDKPWPTNLTANQVLLP